MATTLDPESNSLAVLVKHVGGNLTSRFTDFLTSDGEKPNRDRDSEFVVSSSAHREAIVAQWNAGWQRLTATLGELRGDELRATVRIRGQEMSALAAINRALAHIANHVGQIVYLAKHLRSTDWQTLSIPRGRSADFVPAQSPTPPSRPAGP